MSNCSNHKKDLYGESDMKKVAEAIGDLNYETLAQLFDHLVDKINDDAIIDFNHSRKKLATRLIIASTILRKARNEFGEAWKISKPFMEDKK